MILIGFGGLKGSGKDTACDAIAAARTAVKVGMSDPLHAAVLTLNPIVEVDMDGTVRTYAELVEQVGYTNAKKVPEVRRLLQVMGTEVGRNMIDPNLWTTLAERSIVDYGPSAVVVTGIRFMNELNMIRRLGGLAVYVRRPGINPDDLHPSEVTLRAEDFDQVWDNDTTQAEFEEFAVHAWDEHLRIKSTGPIPVQDFGPLA